MLRKAWVGAVLVFGGLSVPAYGQVKLEWKFNEGDKFYVEDVSTMKQKIGFMGKDIDQTLKTTMVTSYTVKKKTGSDVVVLEQKIEGVDVKSMGGIGGETDKMMEKLKGAKFTITLNLKDGKITAFEGYEDFIKALTEGNEEAGKFVKMMLSEDVLKKGCEEVFTFLPGKAVAKGEAWKKEQTIPFGPLGSFKTINDYTYQGKEENLEKIALKAQLTYAPPKGDAGFGLFKIVKGNLKSEGARGTLLFDAKKGRLSKYSMAMVFRGSLTMDIMGNMIDMEVTIDQNSNSRVLNRNPLAGQKE